jgi:two-component system chemotaxis response regulator CheB
VEGNLPSNEKGRMRAHSVGATRRTKVGAAPAPPARRDEPAGLTCPTCHGALSEEIDGAAVSYLCHTGHTFGIESLLAGQDEDVELALWSAVRALQEKIFFLNRLIDRNGPASPSAMIERHMGDRTRLEHHVAVLRRMLESG